MFSARNQNTASLFLLHAHQALLGNLCGEQQQQEEEGAGEQVAAAAAAATSPDVVSSQWVNLCWFYTPNWWSCEEESMDEGTELSLTIAQIVQRLKGSHLHSQIERQAKVSRLACG